MNRHRQPSRFRIGIQDLLFVRLLHDLLIEPPDCLILEQFPVAYCIGRIQQGTQNPHGIATVLHPHASDSILITSVE
jgi:hypothetical protein